jgi:hypothetical protein
MGGLVLRIRHLTPWAIAAMAVLIAAPCRAQGNIDAGKSPAQIFAEACTVCHRDARELKRRNVAFLRQHYTSGYQQAALMADYLSRLPSEPRPAQSRPSPTAASPGEAAKQQPRQQPASPDQARSEQGQPKGRRVGTAAEVRSSQQPGVEENQSASPAVAATIAPAAPAEAPASHAPGRVPLVVFQE